MGRYDLVTGKKKEKRQLVDPDDDIGEDIKNYRSKKIRDTDEEELQANQTSIRGKTLLLRGPNGYQVSIPLRYVSIHHAENSVGEYEMHLKISPDIARALHQDIQVSQNDANESLRLQGVGIQVSGRR